MLNVVVLIAMTWLLRNDKRYNEEQGACKRNIEDLMMYVSLLIFAACIVHKRWQYSIKYSSILLKLIIVQVIIKYTLYLTHDMAIILMLYICEHAVSDVLKIISWPNLSFLAPILVAVYMLFFKIVFFEAAEKIYFGHLVGIVFTQLMTVLTPICDLFIDFLESE